MCYFVGERRSPDEVIWTLKTCFRIYKSISYALSVNLDNLNCVCLDPHLDIPN